MKAESRQIPQKLAARLKFVYCVPLMLQVVYNKTLFSVSWLSFRISLARWLGGKIDAT